MNEIQEYWSYADSRQAELHQILCCRWGLYTDEIQEALDRFQSKDLFRFLTAKEREALHRRIQSWKEQGYTDSYQLKLYLNDLGRRTRIRQEEALFLWMFVLSWAAYRDIMLQDIPILTEIAQDTYRRETERLQAVLGKNGQKPPTEREIKNYLSKTLPDGSRLDRQMSDYAQYTAKRVSDTLQKDVQQGRTADVNSPEYQKILQSARNKLLKPSEPSEGQPNGFHGYLDQVMTSVTGYTVTRVFQESGVEQYQFIAVVDDRTTHACRSLHRKIFKVKDMKLGVNVPPITIDGQGQPIPHPCRSMIRAVFGAEDVAAVIRSSGNGGKEGRHTFKKVGSIDKNNEKEVKLLISIFEEQYVQSKTEHCLVIAENGDVYLIDGDKNTVDTSLLGEKMNGSINTHNHPARETQYSFSDDDILSFLQDGSEVMRAFDERYIYEVRRPEHRITSEEFRNVYSAANNNAYALVAQENEAEGQFEFLRQHVVIQTVCRILGIPYRRWEK